MKTITNKIVLLLLTVLALTSCTEDMKFKDVDLTSVEALYFPLDKEKEELLTVQTASLFFEWESSKTEDGAAPLYEVLFDKVGGNFSEPLYTVIADNNGMSNFATISHKTLNSISGFSGVEPGEEGDIIWTVRASRGMNERLSSQSRTLTLKRYVGFTEFPKELYIVGEGTETGADIANAMLFSVTGQGEYEIFVKLTEGKSYKLVGGKENGAKTYYIDNAGIITEGESETTVKKSGIYCIQLDFGLAGSALQEVKSIGIWNCDKQAVIFDLPYTGKGIWSREGTLSFPEDRYKLLMVVADAKGDANQFWGTKNATDGSPQAGEVGSYFHIKRVPDDRWNDKWKFIKELNNTNVEISVIMQGGSDYTHTVSSK